MFPMDRRILNSPHVVEYDSRGKRVRKSLPDAYTARRFYATKLKAGKRPKLIAPSR